MVLSEDTLLKFARLPLERLVVPGFYEDLFLAAGESNFNRPHETVVCARPLDRRNNRYEIVAGVELFKLYRREGRETVPSLIAEMSAEEARRFATDHALRTSAQSARRSVVQILVAARDNEEHGGVWSVDRVTEQIGIKRSTYTHAWSSVSYACVELKKKCPDETEGLGTTEMVAMAVRTDFMPAFTSLYKGEMTVNKFYREYYLVSDLSRERSRQQQEAKAKARPGTDAAGGAPAGAKVIPLARPTSPTATPDQLMADGIVKFAQALDLFRVGGAASAAGSEVEVERLVSDLLDEHRELQGGLLRLCEAILDRLKASRQTPRPRGVESGPKKARKARPKPEPDLPLIDCIPVAV